MQTKEFQPYSFVYPLLASLSWKISIHYMIQKNEDKEVNCGHHCPVVCSTNINTHLGAGDGTPPGSEEGGGRTLPSVGRNHFKYLSTRTK